MNSRLAQTLLRPTKLGDLIVPNKIAMSSVNTLKADPNTGVPNDFHVNYYSQRASAGLILSEAAPISKSSLSVLGAGSLYTPEQVKGWKKVTDAVHAQGGKMFAQLWHGGRTAHSEVTGEQPIAPSALKVRDIPRGRLDYEVPREMTHDDIKEMLDQYRQAAQNARQAGFDGVELHGGNGYLIDQFLRDSSNQRTDEYGGTPENRARFALEVMDTLIGVFGRGRVGIKVSPVGRFHDMYDSDPLSTYKYLLEELDKREIAYVQIAETDSNPAPGSRHETGHNQLSNAKKALRPFFNGSIMAYSSLSPESASKAIEDGEADLVSLRKPFISNPDLVARIQNQRLFNQWDFFAFYPSISGTSGASQPLLQI